MLLDILFVGSAAFVGNGIAILIVWFQNGRRFQPIPIPSRIPTRIEESTPTAKWDETFVDGLTR